MNAFHPAKDADQPGPLDVSRAATAVLDADGTVTGWSPTAQELLGYSPEEILGRPADTLLADGGPGSLLEAARTGRRVLNVRRRDGRTVRVAAATTTLTTPDERPARLLALADAQEAEESEALRSMLRGLATQSPIGLAIYNTALRVVWTNAALYEEMGTADYLGVGPDEMVADGEVLSAPYPPTLEETMRQVLDTGEPVIELHYRGRPPGDPERDHVWSCSYYRLRDASSVTLGVCEETVDITERYLAQQRLDLLVRAGARVGTTLDIARTAEELAAVAVPQFADSVTVDLMEAVLHGDRPEPGTEPDGPLARVWGDARERPEAEGAQVSVSGVTGERPEAEGAQASMSVSVSGDTGERPETDWPTPSASGDTPAGARDAGPPRVTHPPRSAQARALASGRPVHRRHPDHPERMLLAVPLRAEAATLGVVTFGWDRHPDPFEAGELAVADELAARAAVCIDNARRYTREHSAALMLQRSLLPRNLPELTAVEVASRYLPADGKAGVGGDWFDVIPLSGTRVGLVVGDVVGHGLRAAATMGRLRTSVRAFAQLDLAPDELLARLDDLVGQPGDPSDLALGVTCLYAVYDPVSGVCRAARAGHPPPAVVDPGTGEVTFPDLPPGPPLGLGGLPFETAELTLPEGSVLALFTDGLVRTHDRDVDAQLDRLRTVLADHDRPLDELCDRVTGSLLPGPPDDDVALLLVRTRILDHHRTAEWELAADPEVVGLARTAAATQVRDWDLDELTFTTELVVSELVTNAIRYAGSGPVRLRLIRDRSLICEVSDTGHTSPHLRHASTDDEGGRGLFLIAQLTQHWGARYTPTGKTIWAEQTLPAD
ncbi:SpoIIE family protein phosphatase [Streptomyces purpureus]|uniref:SpoIIE family protein phosphatase n=1 Tax=Streptomyces purpureus TaxID=1951 RepID=UPI0037A240CF